MSKKTCETILIAGALVLAIIAASIMTTALYAALNLHTAGGCN